MIASLPVSSASRRGKSVAAVKGLQGAPPHTGNALVSRGHYLSWPLSNLAGPGVDDKFGRRAVLDNHDFISDPAIRLFESGADGFSRTCLFCHGRCRGQVDRSLQRSSQFELVLLVEFGHRGGSPFTYD